MAPVLTHVQCSTLTRKLAKSQRFESPIPAEGEEIRQSTAEEPKFRWGSWRGKMGAGISLFWGWENGIVSLGRGILSLGLGFTNEKTIEKWDWDFDLNTTREMGMGFAQNPDWEMGWGPPPPFRTLFVSCVISWRACLSVKAKIVSPFFANIFLDFHEGS